MNQPPQQPPQWWQPPVQAPGPQPGREGHGGQWWPQPGREGHGGQWWPQPAQYGGPPAQPLPNTPASHPAPSGAPAAPASQYGGFQGGQSQYGGLGAFEESIKSAKKPFRKRLVIGLILVIAAVGGLATAWLLGAFSGDTLDQNSLQDGVTNVLHQGYGESDVTNVQCPSGEQIKAGNTFDCTVQVAGQSKKVSIRVMNDKPEFEVGAPH
jgi:hypothetical protein